MPPPRRPLRAGALAGQCALLALSVLLTACAPAAPQASAWGLSAEAQRGRLLLAQYQCGSCHSIPEVAGARSRAGPALDGYGRRSYIAGHVPNDADALARWIMDPAALAPGTRLPDMGVPPDDARAMAAFLSALR